MGWQRTAGATRSDSESKDCSDDMRRPLTSRGSSIEQWGTPEEIRLCSDNYIIVALATCEPHLAKFAPPDELSLLASRI